MRKILLFSLAMVIGMTVVAQQAKLKNGIPLLKYKTTKKIAIEPERTSTVSLVKPQPSGLKNSDNTKGFVNVIQLGTSANAYGWGYGGGHKTSVWADDNLNAVMVTHRMGPGSTPPSFSGYLAGDLGVNLGQSDADWTINRQMYAATLNNGGTYYLDAARYPNGGIYNPAGNTVLANAYGVYFAANLSNGGTWGGYSFGTDNLVNQADSVKNLTWFNPPPYNYIPDGFSISQNGLALACDKDYDETDGYHGNIIVNRGVWNAATHDFDYTETLLPLVTADNNAPTDDRIAFSPDGQTAWIVTIGNNGGAVQIGDSANLYPILFKSIDAGLTWSDPIAVQLDGPNGIAGVKSYLSEYNIQQLYNPPYPTQEQIPHTTAFDCDLSVDKFGNPHIGVVIGICPGNYSIATADSSYCVFDIYSTDGGTHWQGVNMGYPWTFRGTFGGTDTEDNRVNISTTQTGDKVFVTWNDTQMAGVTDNNMPDVFARGFDLLTNKITSNSGNQPNNVSIISEVSSSAWMQVMSHYVFTDNSKYTLPIVTEFLTVPTDLTAPVNFKYLADFYYVDADFSIPVNNPWVGVDQKKQDIAVVSIYPNPVKDLAKVSVNLKQSADVSIQVTNLVGQVVIARSMGNMPAGARHISVDVSDLTSGVYLVTVITDGQKITQKMMVE